MTYRHKLTRENYFKRLPHRCCKCQARRTLSKRWSLYVRKPKCHICGYARLKPCFDQLNRRGQNCNCGGYPFIHRRRSKYCYEHPNAEQHHTERAEAHA